MKLHDLVPNAGSKKNRKRVGRGISAGQGKTAGRGTKGQGSRSGEGGRLYRQGGNLPFYRRLPFMRGEGFTPPNQVDFQRSQSRPTRRSLQEQCGSKSGNPRKSTSAAGFAQPDQGPWARRVEGRAQS